MPCVRLYRAAGYEPALDLAEGLARFALKHTKGYLPDGRLGAAHQGLEDHFHTRSNFILGVLDLGLTTGQREYIAWVRQSYERAKEWGSDFGWFPEGLGQRHGEVCGTVDMIEIALLLGRHVEKSCYADSERFGRNHLLESRLLSLDRLREALDRFRLEESPSPAGPYSTTEGVMESQVGGFASRPALNDALHRDAPSMM